MEPLLSNFVKVLYSFIGLEPESRPDRIDPLQPPPSTSSHPSATHLASSHIISQSHSWTARPAELPSVIHPQGSNAGLQASGPQHPSPQP